MSAKASRLVTTAVLVLCPDKEWLRVRDMQRATVASIAEFEIAGCVTDEQR
jgi:hypothetical protein